MEMRIDIAGWRQASLLFVEISDRSAYRNLLGRDCRIMDWSAYIQGCHMSDISVADICIE